MNGGETGSSIRADEGNVDAIIALAEGQTGALKIGCTDDTAVIKIGCIFEGGSGRGLLLQLSLRAKREP